MNITPHPTAISDQAPVRRRGHSRRTNVMLAAAVGAAILGSCGAAWAAPSPGAVASPAASATTDSGARSQQEVALIAESATVFIAGEWSGYVQFPTSSGYAWSSELTADFSCSGFIASSDGNVVTAGHCADPAEGKPQLVDAFLEQQVNAGNITEADAQQFVDQGAETQWAVQGLENGSQPSLAMKVYQTASASGIEVSAGLTATVVDNRPLDQGDVTLLKVTPTTPLPTLQLAPAGPNVGDTVDAVGYPGSVAQVVDSNLEPTFAQGQVGANQQTSNGAPFTEVSAAMSPGMSGGPVVDDQGRVVGTVSFGPGGETQQLNFAAGWDTIKSLLARDGVNNTPSAADTAYRQGLDLYFAGKYREAAAEFTTVLDAEPSNAFAQQYEAKAVSSEGSEPQPAATVNNGTTGANSANSANGALAAHALSHDHGSSPLVPVGIAIVIVALVAGGLLVVRRRRGPVAAQVIGGYPVNGPAPTMWRPVPTQPMPSQPGPSQPMPAMHGGWMPPQARTPQSWE